MWLRRETEMQSVWGQRWNSKNTWHELALAMALRWVAEGLDWIFVPSFLGGSFRAFQDLSSISFSVSYTPRDRSFRAVHRG